MNTERYCAEQIRLKENETFLAVAGKAGARFDPNFSQLRAEGAALRLPDLFSVTSASRYRVREVKFKLEDRLVRKALTQLEVGARQVLDRIPESIIDRLEIVVPLRGRELQENEKKFLGKGLDANRYSLLLDGAEIAVSVLGQRCEITVLVF